MTIKQKMNTIHKGKHYIKNTNLLPLLSLKNLNETFIKAKNI